MTKIDNMYQEKEEEDTPALKIASMHQYKGSKTTLKRAKKDLLYWPETAQRI